MKYLHHCVLFSRCGCLPEDPLEAEPGLDERRLRGDGERDFLYGDRAGADARAERLLLLDRLLLLLEDRLDPDP